MSDQGQAKFEGWGKLEALGHQSCIGFISTQPFGQAVMFRVDVPELAAREVTLTRPEYDGEGRMLPAGSVVQRVAVAGYSVMYGAGSIYRITPCTEEAARTAIERECGRALKLVSLPPGQTLAAPVDPFDDAEVDDPDEVEAPF